MVAYCRAVISVRHCSKPNCTQPAVSTLTYDYRESTAVLGPLATSAEPHAYDLCELHSEHLSAPRGWQIVRLQTSFEPAPPSTDDLLALVDAVRLAAEEPLTVTPPAASRSSRVEAEPSSAITDIFEVRNKFQVVRGPYGSKNEE